jgi:hypothetical protein
MKLHRILTAGALALSLAANANAAIFTGTTVTELASSAYYIPVSAISVERLDEEDGGIVVP